MHRKARANTLEGESARNLDSISLCGPPLFYAQKSRPLVPCHHRRCDGTGTPRDDAHGPADLLFLSLRHGAYVTAALAVSTSFSPKAALDLRARAGYRQPMNDQGLSATELQSTPLEKSLRAQWYGTDEIGYDPGASWEGRKAAAAARIAAAAKGQDTPPTDLEEWLAEMPDEWMVRYLLALRSLGVRTLAAKAARVSTRFAEGAMKDCPEFAAAVARTRASVLETCEGALFVGATVGDPEPVFDKGEHVGWKRKRDTKAAIALLEAEHPSKWRKAETSIQIANVLPDALAVGDALRRLAEVQKVALEGVPHAETPSIEAEK